MVEKPLVNYCNPLPFPVLPHVSPHLPSVLCQGNSCFHPPKGKIAHSLHSPNSFLFLLLSVYKIQMLQTGLITSISFAEFTITFCLLTFSFSRKAH